MATAARTALTGAALLAAVGGAVLDAGLHGAGVLDTWSVLLAASWLPPLVALLTARTPAGRWVALAATLVAGAVALPLVPFGYGAAQLPAVVLLALAARRDG